MSSKFQAPKGVSEYIPPRSALFEYVVEQLESVARSANYQLIELPVFEDTELFTRGVGETTDVVTKEMYTFEDRGGRSLTLRPEGTAGVVRAVIEHGLDRGQLPVKLFYRGQFFRAERPQAGRYRQFYQFGIEALGLDDPYLDAEIIAIADRGFRNIGLVDYVLEISSLGDVESRSRHRKDFVEFLQKAKIDEETLGRIAKNPLRILDDKRSEIQDRLKDAPLLLDYLSEGSRAKFNTLQRALRDLDISFRVNPRMVRGLDYYSGTAFEFIHNRLGAQASMGGGGRYDGLMETLGGQALSGIGFGIGIDRTILAMESENLVGRSVKNLDLFIVPIGESVRSKALGLVQAVRAAGLIADMGFGERSLKGAMKAADKLSAQYVLVLGEDEIVNNSARLKRMSDGHELSITLESLIPALKEALP